MRYIKFRSLQRAGNKKIELVRVTDNGKILSKGYGPLEFQVLDGNVRNQGINIRPANILCYGATDTIDDVTITGAVDVYIDGIDQPVLSNVTEDQLRNLTQEDFHGLLKPYTPTPITPTQSFHFLLQHQISDMNGNYNDFLASMVFGVKPVGEDIRWYSTNTVSDTSYYGNNYFFYSTDPNSLSNYVVNMVDILAGFAIESSCIVKPFIKPDDIFTKLKHGEYFRKFYSGYLNATLEQPYRSENGCLSMPTALTLSLNLPPEIEYVVFPTLETPYGNEIDKFLINTTMMYDNIVYYQDGTIVVNDVSVPTLPSTNLYQQDNVDFLDIGATEFDVPATFDISHIEPMLDQSVLLEGRYVDITFTQPDIQRALFAYTTADEQEYRTQGISWLDTKLGGRQTHSLIMAFENMGAFYPADTGYITLSPDVTQFHTYWPISNRRYRIKFPTDVTEFTITLFQ